MLKELDFDSSLLLETTDAAVMHPHGVCAGESHAATVPCARSTQKHALAQNKLRHTARKHTSAPTGATMPRSISRHSVLDIKSRTFSAQSWKHSEACVMITRTVRPRVSFSHHRPYGSR